MWYFDNVYKYNLSVRSFVKVQRTLPAKANLVSEIMQFLICLEILYIINMIVYCSGEQRNLLLPYRNVET